MFNGKTNVGFSYIDYLAFLSCCMTILFMLAFMKMSINSVVANVQEKAEFIVEMTWEDGSKNDVDLWMENPVGNILYYRNKATGLMVLDHDDLATSSDELVVDGVTRTVPYRREVATIRGIIPGTYTINIMMYRLDDVHKPSDVRVTIRKLNPYSEILSRTIHLEVGSEEVTAARMTLAANGSVTNLETKNDESLSKKVLVTP